MKNKVLRLAIIAVLVVAMVLSMAACVDPVPPVDPSPSASPAVSPSAPVVTKTPDKTPVVPGGDDDSALAKATYGIEISKMDFIYGEVYKDDTKVAPNVLSNSLSTVEFKYDAKLLQNYKLDGTTKLPFTLIWKVEYEGEDTTVKTANITNYYVEKFNVDDEDTLSTVKHHTLTFKDTAPVGTYTVTATVVAEDNGFYFGRFGSIKEDKVTYELVTIVNVAKADLTIKTPSYVAPVKAAGDTAETPVSPKFIIATKADAGDKLANAQFAKDMEAAFGTTAGYVYMFRASSMMDTTKTGSHEFIPYVFKKDTTVATADINTAIAFEDLVSINYNVKFENGKQHFISQYDWNVIRDTATSILELDKNNAAEKLTLARARYDALTAEQKVFFVSGAVDVDTSTTHDSATYSIGKFNGAGSTSVELNAAATTGKAILTALKTAEKAMLTTAISVGFNKVMKESKLAILAGAGGANFNIENATHVAAFTTVKTYYDALSVADKAAIAEDLDTTTVANKLIYDNVSGKFGAKAVTDTQALIAAAIAAYNRAILSATANTIIFEDTKATTDAAPIKVGDNTYGGVVNYLNNAEVKAVTAQAKAAFDKLPLAVQKILSATALAGDDAADAEAYFDIDALTYGAALEALVTMNAVVVYMEQVVGHTKIEDLANTANNSTAYVSLKTIVFGGPTSYLADQGKILRSNYFAVSDIMRAYATDSASLEAVVVEYKAMVDYILAAEAHKATVVAALNAAIAAQFTAANDYDATDIAIATAPKNAVLVGLVNAITSEGTHTATTKRKGSVATAITVAVCGKTTQQLLNVKANESYADAMAGFEGMINFDKVSDAFEIFYNSKVTAHTTDGTAATTDEILFIDGTIEIETPTAIA